MARAPTASRAGVMHPAAWIVWAACGAIVAMTTTNPFYLSVVLAAAWVVHAAHRRPGPHARSFGIFLGFAALTVVTRTLLVLLTPSSIDASTIATAFLEGLRLGVMLTVFGAFNSVADPFGVLRLAPRRFHEPALAAALALSIAPRTIASVGRVRDAQRLRGIQVSGWRTVPALAVPVLETGMEEAVSLAESMDARGHGRGPRSRYRPDRWTIPAFAIAVAATLSAAAFVRAAMSGIGDVSVQTFPLQWPGASVVLVVAGLLLSLPAVFRADDR